MSPLEYAFLTPVVVQDRHVARNARASQRSRCPPTMSQPVSRRDLGKLVLATSAAAAISSLCGNTASANAAVSGKQKAPNFIKDDSGIQYYDVKVGNGATPIEGDFVIIDYVCYAKLLTNEFTSFSLHSLDLLPFYKI